MTDDRFTIKESSAGFGTARCPLWYVWDNLVGHATHWGGFLTRETADEELARVVARRGQTR